MRHILAVSAVLVLTGLCLAAEFKSDEAKKAQADYAAAAGAQPPEARCVSLAQGVVQEVRNEVPPDHVPVYRDFASESISALTGVGELNGPAEETAVHSIVQAVLMHNRNAGKMSPDDLRKRLKQFLDRHRGNLAGVTPEMLLTDWSKRRRDVAKDVETVRGMVEALFKGRPVVVLNPPVNGAVRLGRDSVVGLTFTGQDLKDASKNQIPQEKVSENARKIVMSEVSRRFDRLGEGAGYIDSIYMMAELRYRGPLTAEGAKALNQYIEKALLYDGVCVIADRGVLMSDVFLVLRKYLFFGADIPAVPEEAARNETVRKAFQVLWNSTGGGIGFPPVAFGGAVPEDILSGKRFGFKPGMSVEEGQRLSAQRAAEQEAKRDFESLVHHWFSRIMSKVDRSGYVDRMAEDLLWSFYDEWKGKAFLLKDFFGDKTEAELKFSPLEQRVLDALRRDRKSSVLFSDQEVSKDDRVKAFDRFFHGAPTAEHAAYQAIAQDLGVWLKQRYSASVTPEMERGERLRARAEALLQFLGNDVREVNGFEDTKPTVSLLFLARKKLRQLQAFTVDKPLSQAVLKDLTPLERALYHYFDRAKAQNPVLGNIESSFTDQMLFERYRNYLRAGRPKEEQQAYEDAVRALAEQMGKQLRVPKAEQLISFPNSPEAKPRGRG